MLAVVSNDTARKSKGGRGRVQCSYERHNCLATRDCVCVCVLFYSFSCLALRRLAGLANYCSQKSIGKWFSSILFHLSACRSTHDGNMFRRFACVRCANCERYERIMVKPIGKLNLSGSEEHAHRARISAEKSHSSCLRPCVCERKSVCWWEDFSARCENEYWKQNRSIDLIYYFMDVQCTLAHFMYVRMQR